MVHELILFIVINYNLYNLSMQATFEGGKQSNVVVYPYPSMASPALTPQAIKSYYNIPVSQRVSRQRNRVERVGRDEGAGVGGREEMIRERPATQGFNFCE